jgi:hypothetical protein
MHFFSYIDSFMFADRITVVTLTVVLRIMLLSTTLLSERSTAAGVRIRVMALLSRVGSLCASRWLLGGIVER